MVARKKYRRILKKGEVEDMLTKNTKQCFDLFKEMVKILKEHRQFLDKMASANEVVEDTLLNVLLAIRQNEYLQAWYPKQGPHPEMKVVGHHPAGAVKQKQERRKRGEPDVY